jgi:hypothetical protein
MTEPPRPAELPPEPRLLDAMPRAVLVVFLFASVVALVAVGVLIARPPSAEVALGERRPPPRGSLTHDAGRLFPAPPPTRQPPFDPPCPEVASVRIEGGVAFVGRMEDAFDLVCSVAEGGPRPDLTRAIRGFRDVTIRVSQFERTGVESVADLDARAIYLNLLFTAKQLRVVEAVPVLFHEAYHLLHYRHIDAREELAARRVELSACREFLGLRADWPRWCADAEALLALPVEEARDLLASAGYAR